jgi:hypothetical protein
MYENAMPPDDLTCEKCGSTVFRRFDASTRPNDVQSDFSASTERDTSPDDASTDVTRGDILDLENL